MQLLVHLLSLVFIARTNAYSFFNHWTCIGFIDKIDFSQPYVSNIGEMPLVTWKDERTNKYITTVNICKHMGSTLDNAKITDGGCLKCQYHGLEMTPADRFGETVEHEGKLFWAHNPKNSLPHETPFFSNPDYEHTFLQIDMKSSLIDGALNTMDVRHPEYVHNKIIGFGSNIPPTNLKQYQYKDRVGLSFEYQSNKLVQYMNSDTLLSKNYHMFIYPSFTWSKVSFMKKDLIISVNFQPLTPNKTRWYVTVCHNYYKNEIQKNVMKTLAASILSQDYIQMKNQYEENSLKKAVLFGHTFSDEEVVTWLYKMFQDSYVYPDVDECARCYKDAHKKM